MPEVTVEEGLNKDYKERDQIIFKRELNWEGERGESLGGTVNFKHLTLEQLQALRDGNFIKLTDTQNDSPTAEEFLAFMEQYPGVAAHGYAVSPRRSDYRVSIEGLTFEGECDDKMQLVFSTLCRRADEIHITSTTLFCWYD